MRETGGRKMKKSNTELRIMNCECHPMLNPAHFKPFQSKAWQVSAVLRCRVGFGSSLEQRTSNGEDTEQ